MSGARELRRRIKSVVSTEQITGAMKTVAVAKYNRTLSALKGFTDYADACERLLHWLPQTSEIPNEAAPVLYCLLTANRGLCGEYNTALLHYYEALPAEDKPRTLLPCGNFGIAYMREHNEEATVGSFTVSDIPQFGEAAALTKLLREKYDNGEASRVVFITQRYENILVQTPRLTPFLPFGAREGSAADEEEYIWMPDKEKVRPQLLRLCENAFVYRLLLEAAAGAHGATLTAMRAASDNSADIRKELETELNRLRQSSVTTAVLELAGGQRTEETDGEEDEA